MRLDIGGDGGSGSRCRDGSKKNLPLGLREGQVKWHFLLVQQRLFDHKGAQAEPKHGAASHL